MKAKIEEEKTIVVHVRVPMELKKKLEDTAESTGLDISSIVRAVVMDAYKNGGIKLMIGNRVNHVGRATNSTITQTIGK